MPQRLPHVTGLGGKERVTLRPELGSVKACARRLGGSRARELASLQAGRYRAWSRAPGAMGEYRKRPRGKHGAPPASAWSEWKHETGSE